MRSGRALGILALVLCGWVRVAAAQAVPLPVAVRHDAIVVRAEAGMERAAERIAELAPDALAAIADDLPDLPVPRDIEIRLVHDADELAGAAPAGRGAPRWAIGVAYPDLGVIVVAGRRGPDPIDLVSVVKHELAHLALGAALHGRAPRWLDEGFAYLHSSDWSMARTRTLTGLAWSGDVIPLDELDRHFQGGEDEADVAYAQSYDFVAFLAVRGRYRDADDDGDRWPFRRFLAEIAGGAEPGAAATTAYATRIHDLYDEWFAALRQRFMMIPAELVGGLLWVVGALLLFLGYLRRRRQTRRVLALWELQEAGAEAAPPSVPS